MSFEVKLSLLLDEYLDEEDKKSISKISIAVPDRLINFWIADSRFHLLNEGAEFSLAIYFSLKEKSKKDKKLLQIADSTDCLKAFTRQSVGKKSIGYTKSFGTDKKGIIEAINCILREIFPEINNDDVKLNLERRNFFTLYD